MINSEMFPWIPTEEYLKMLREDARFAEVEGDPSAIVGEITYDIDFLQNLNGSRKRTDMLLPKKFTAFS